MTFGKKAKLMETAKCQGCVVRGEQAGMNRHCPEEFGGRENTPRGTIMMDTCPHPFVQIHRTYHTKSESLCKLWTSGDNDIKVGSLVVTNVPPG